MKLRLQKISNYGTSTPAVVRTFYQGCSLLEWFDVPPDQIEATKEVLQDLQRHLVRCVEQRDALATEISSAIQDVDKLRDAQPAANRSNVLPGVGDLEGRAEAFLHAAKLAVAATGRLTQPFYGEGFNHKYQHFLAWAEKKFGKEDEFATVVQRWEPFARRVCSMRNAVDHPKDEPGGRLVTRNFEVADLGNDEDSLSPPVWGLLGEDLQPMLDSFDEHIEQTIRLGEDVLSCLFYKLKPPLPVVLKEIPEADRDPSKPIRLEVVLGN